MTGTEGCCAYDLVVHVAAPAIKVRKSRRPAPLLSVSAFELAHVIATSPLPPADRQSIAPNGQTVLNQIMVRIRRSAAARES